MASASWTGRALSSNPLRIGERTAKHKRKFSVRIASLAIGGASAVASRCHAGKYAESFLSALPGLGNRNSYEDCTAVWQAVAGYPLDAGHRRVSRPETTASRWPDMAPRYA